MGERIRVVVLALLAGAFVLPAAPASAAEPSLTLTTNRSVYVTGQTARITVRVQATNLDYDIAFRTAGSAEWKYFNASSGVNTDTFTESLYLGYNLQIRARL